MFGTLKKRGKAFCKLFLFSPLSVEMLIISNKFKQTFPQYLLTVFFRAVNAHFHLQFFTFFSL